jgi:hypothetical protein
MKKLIGIIFLLSSLTLQAKVYESFICYTQQDMAVIYGIKQDVMSHSSLNVHYSKLENNPLVMPLNITQFNHEQHLAEAVSVNPDSGTTILKIRIEGMQGRVYLDLREFAGTEDVLMEDELAMCYFGYLQD